MIREVNFSKGLVGRLTHGSDLLDELNRLCRAHELSFGRVEAIGAVQKSPARLLQPVEGAAFVRGFDEETGLPLWKS